MDLTRQKDMDETRQWDRGPIVGLLCLVWFVGGTLVFFCFALLAFAVNPFATHSVFEPEGYRMSVLVWHLPMAFGWVPAAYRAARKRESPWRNAKTTVLFGIFVGPVVFLLVMLGWRLFLQANASV